MKWIWIIPIIALLVVIDPLTAEAERTRVYISISVGGAVIVGGAFIAWSLTYGTRVSQKDPGPSPLPALAYALTELPGQTSNPAFDRFLQRSSSGNQPLALEVPLFIYQW
ncbi:MAG: hypothetical protein ACREIQ_06905 [Nitrospiria bacterium]